MPTTKNLKYKRPLLKLSGEILGGPLGAGLEKSILEDLAIRIKTLYDEGIVPGIVIGGGNFIRGAQSSLPSVRRHKADAIGMIATVMNAICFAEHLSHIGIKTEVFSSFPIGTITKPYDIDQAIDCFEKKTVCLFSAGTGNPYFSTDSAAALRAIETSCDLLIKGTKVDGVYESDPLKNPEAKKFDIISYDEIIRRNLKIMDIVAITLCRDNKMPLKILSLKEPNALLLACKGLTVGTDVVTNL